METTSCTVLQQTWKHNFDYTACSCYFWPRPC